MTTIWTAGHSNLPIDELIELLNQHDIGRVVDVRTKPYSRWCPQYNKARFGSSLVANGIKYDWRGENLGGLGENVNYEETLTEIRAIAATERIALICTEKDPKKCHRQTMLEPDLARLGVHVVHIEYPAAPA